MKLVSRIRIRRYSASKRKAINLSVEKLVSTHGVVLSTAKTIAEIGAQKNYSGTIRIRSKGSSLKNPRKKR